MSTSELWWLIIQGIAVGATIFGLIVAVFSVYNGRMTRRELGELTRQGHQETQAFIAREMEANRQLLDKMSAQNGTIIDRIDKTLERIDGLYTQNAQVLDLLRQRL